MSITPFAADGTIDEVLLRAHLLFLAGAGVGVYVASQGSGEGDLLALDEKLRVYRIAAEALHAKVPVVAAGIGLAGSTTMIRDLALGAVAAGVDAVQLLGPRPGPLPLRRDELATYFRTILDAVHCEVHLASNSVLTGYDVPVDLIEALVRDYPHVRIVNVTDHRPEVFDAVVQRLSERVEVRVGITTRLERARALGARGFLSFEANVAPRLVADMDTETLLPLNALLARGGNPRSLKAALRMLGRDGGELRPPYLPLTDEQMRDLEQGLRDLALR